MPPLPPDDSLPRFGGERPGRAATRRDLVRALGVGLVGLPLAACTTARPETPVVRIVSPRIAPPSPPVADVPPADSSLTAGPVAEPVAEPVVAVRETLRPRRVRAGGTIGLVAPAGVLRSPGQVSEAAADMRAMGFEARVGRHALDRYGFLAGSDQHRADDFMAMVTDPDVDAVVCLRGGYGVLRILDALDYDAARASRPLVVGYSDVTALHLALLAQAGLTGLSGPMVAPDWPHLDAETEAHFWRLAGGETGVSLAGPGDEQPFGLADGDAEGLLVGGNLSLVAALLGTPFLPDLTGAVLVLEDVGEAPYRIDGLLARLRLAGVLERLGGLVFGMFTGADPLPDRPSLDLADVLDTYAACVDGPVAAGLTYGHVRRKVTLPVGVTARLTVDGPAARLVTTSPVTAPPVTASPVSA